MNLKKSMAALLAAVFMTGSVGTCLAEGTARETLMGQISESTRKLIVTGEDDLRLYANIRQASRADSLPPRLDLRDRGVVPPIRSQGHFGTCWGFASIAASEISLLSELGMTTEEYREHYGQDMDLSERHLAWFSSLPIAQEENMSVHDQAQVGEGRTLLNDDGSAPAHLDI